MKVFKRPCQAVLNTSILDEAILILMNHSQYFRLQPICQRLGQT
jgi:hypothetical protein